MEEFANFQVPRIDKIRNSGSSFRVLLFTMLLPKIVQLLSQFLNARFSETAKCARMHGFQ
jgi:hypothetical protein